MKKVFLFILSLVVLTGCSLINATPTDAVKKFLNNYVVNDGSVIEELNDYLTGENLDDDIKKSYKEVYLRQYSNLDYEIKDEVINGDDATVTVAISVYDYYKSGLESSEYFETDRDKFLNENGDIDLTEYLKFKIDKFLKTEERVNYTITLNVKKHDKMWEVEPLTSEDLQKLHGTYEYK